MADGQKRKLLLLQQVCTALEKVKNVAAVDAAKHMTARIVARVYEAGKAALTVSNSKAVVVGGSKLNSAWRGNSRDQRSDRIRASRLLWTATAKKPQVRNSGARRTRSAARR